MTRTSLLEVSIKTYIDCILCILIAPSVLLLSQLNSISLYYSNCQTAVTVTI